MTAEETTAPTAGAHNPLGRRASRMVIGALLLGVLLAMLDQTITGTASITIVREMGGDAGLTFLPWMVTAYLIASTVVTPLFGRISDVYGRKRVYLIALGIFLLGSVTAGVSPSMGIFIAARVIQGVGAGGLVALTFAVIADIVPPRNRGRYTGLSMTVVGLASACGPLLGGFFAGRGAVLGIVTDWRFATRRARRCRSQVAPTDANWRPLLHQHPPRNPSRRPHESAIEGEMPHPELAQRGRFRLTTRWMGAPGPRWPQATPACGRVATRSGAIHAP